MPPQVQSTSHSRPHAIARSSPLRFANGSPPIFQSPSAACCCSAAQGTPTTFDNICQRSSQQRCEPQLRRGDERDGGRHGIQDNGMQRKAETVGLCDSSMETCSPARRRFTGWRAPIIPPAPAPALCTTGEAPVCAGRTAAATCARSPTQRTAHNARRLTVPMLRAGPRW